LPAAKATGDGEKPHEWGYLVVWEPDTVAKATAYCENSLKGVKGEEIANQIGG